MPRLTIRLPDELRGQCRDATTGGDEEQSRQLGSGIEGADDTSQQVLRWMDCWAKSEG